MVQDQKNTKIHKQIGIERKEMDPQEGKDEFGERQT